MPSINRSRSALGQEPGRQEGSRQRAGCLRCLTISSLCGGRFRGADGAREQLREHDPALGDSDPIGGHDLPPYSVVPQLGLHHDDTAESARTAPCT